MAAERLAAGIGSLILFAAVAYLGWTNAPFWTALAAAVPGAGFYVAGHWPQMVAPFARKGVVPVLAVILALQAVAMSLTYGVARGVGVLFG